MPWHRRVVHDIELLLCTHPVHANLTSLLDRIADWEKLSRELLVPELRALVATELADTAARWTPYYDLGLRRYAKARDDELLHPAYGYEPDAAPRDRMAHARRCLDDHARMVERFQEALQRGGYTLAAAYSMLAIRTSELSLWFGLCPDRDALDQRLRAAASGYLRDTMHDSPDRELEQAMFAAVTDKIARDKLHDLRMQWFLKQPSKERQCALGVMITAGTATDYDFTNVPLELLDRLGNPFDPRA